MRQEDTTEVVELPAEQAHAVVLRAGRRDRPIVTHSIAGRSAAPRQWDISTGSVMCCSSSLVTPPSIISRIREWP